MNAAAANDDDDLLLSNNFYFNFFLKALANDIVKYQIKKVICHF